MFTCCLKKLLGVILTWSCSVYAGEITEEKLSSTTLKNGVHLWLKLHNSPLNSISCRVVAKHPHEEAPQIFRINCETSSFEEELPGFIDQCRQAIRRENECKIGVIVVGTFDEEGLKEALGSACDEFKDRSIPAAAPTAVISTSPDKTVYTSVSYATAIQQLKTHQDLKDLLILYILQSMMEDRFKKVTTDARAEWVQPVETRSLLPLSYCTARSRISSQFETKKMLNKFLETIRQFAEEGFSELELTNAKAYLHKNLTAFYQTQPSNTLLADYYSTHFGLGKGCPDYFSFMLLALDLIPKLEVKEVAQIMPFYLKDKIYRATLALPKVEEISSTAIQGDLEKFSKELVISWNGDKGCLVDKKDAYFQLRITEEEKEKIRNIIDTTANKNPLTLLSEKKELLRLGKEVQDVHPFKFLERVFSDSRLKKDMVKIWEWNLLGLGYKKKNGFLNGEDEVTGFAQKMAKENARDNLRPYVVGFAKAVRADANIIRVYVDQQQWEELVKYLIYLKNDI